MNEKEVYTLYRPVSLDHDGGTPGHWTAHRWADLYDDIRDALDAGEIWELGVDELPPDAPAWACYVDGRIYDPPDHLYLYRDRDGWGVIGADGVPCRMVKNERGEIECAPIEEVDNGR